MNENSGLKCGIEIHQQLATQNKLFCECSAAFEDKEPVFEIKRKLRPVAGELGDIDTAAAFEALKNKEFRYKVFVSESCAVELDEQPPHPINQEALEVALKIALKLNCQIPDVIQVMRKTVLDGSSVSGFQRTALIGLNGWIETSSGKVGIDNINLEEDSCQIIKTDKKSATYGLNRLGIPLIEIGTKPDIKTPEQAKEVAEKIGTILRETGKAKRGIGTIRQDLNVSIKGGTRVEIKGFQELKMIPKTIESEIKRQQDLINKNKAIQKEVRKAEPDGTTTFLRPLAGSARLYPETDIPPIIITKDILARAGETSDFEIQKDRYISFLISLGLPHEEAKTIAIKGILNKEILIAGNLVSKFHSLDRKFIWNTITKAPKDIRTRYNSNTENLEEKHFVSIFEKLSKAEISKEAIPEILHKFSERPDSNINDIVKSLGIKTLSEDDLRKIVRKIISEHKDALEKPSPERALMGLVMKEVRGKISGDFVMRILLEEIGRIK